MTINNKTKHINGVSVIICCYNSAQRLPQTLQHLAKQEVPEDIPWEILLINNASTDDTASLAAETWKKFNRKDVSFNILYEAKRRHMYARLCGVTNAKYECIVFCDDDNWLDKNYIAVAHETMEQNNRTGAAGGQNIPATDAEAFPDWWEEYKDKYATGIPAERSGDVTYKGFILGAGIITRKSLFLQVFDERYPSLLKGRNGQQLSTGDDFEYCKRLLLWDYTLYYNDKLKLEHFIPKERLTIDYRRRLLEGIDDAGKILYEYDLALRMYKRNWHKSRLRILLLAPFRLLFAKWGVIDREVIDQQLILFYMSPFNGKSNPVRSVIKRFIHKK